MVATRCRGRALARPEPRWLGDAAAALPRRDCSAGWSLSGYLPRESATEGVRLDDRHRRHRSDRFETVCSANSLTECRDQALWRARSAKPPWHLSPRQVRVFEGRWEAVDHTIPCKRDKTCAVRGRCNRRIGHPKAEPGLRRPNPAADRRISPSRAHWASQLASPARQMADLARAARTEGPDRQGILSIPPRGTQPLDNVVLCGSTRLVKGLTSH